MEVAVSAEELIHVKMGEKISKYASLREFLARKNPGFTVRNNAFVIGQLGLILKGPNKNFREFLKRTADKGVNSKHRYQALVSRILNVTLKGSLQIYKWFRTGARPERAKAKVLPTKEYQSKLASFMKLRGEGKNRTQRTRSKRSEPHKVHPNNMEKQS